MFAIVRPEDAEAMHDHLLALEEKIFQGLELPYRVIDIASGDLGAPAYRKFDVEAWMPGRGEGRLLWRDLQHIELHGLPGAPTQDAIRRTGSKKNELVHMLNGTAVANSRTILALIENHQQADGSIRIPKALQPYVGREVIGGPETSQSLGDE